MRACRIDVVVVYKVDRLTRSLADFATLIELFDAHAVSFVSVTQSFNTTTSMGRLTLNILLSFAQFEREVIGERVRDKIAASKRKGMWVGGPVPLGYAAVAKRLAVMPAEAETVRTIFARYLELGSVQALAQDLDRRGIRTKQRQFALGQHDAPERHQRLAAHRLADDRKGILPDRVVGGDASRGRSAAGIDPRPRPGGGH